MKKNYLYIAMFALLFGACSDEDVVETLYPEPGQPEINIPSEAKDGEILIKFVPEMSDILDQTIKTRGISTRSGIPSTDEILSIIGAYQFERVFPVDPRNEKRTRENGMHLWYLVKFDKNVDLAEAMQKLSKLGEISKMQCNRVIHKAYNHVKCPLEYKPQTMASTRFMGMPFDDPDLDKQWGYINRGGYAFEKEWAKTIAGCDVGCEEAWKKCTGDPSIIVAVMDEGVMVDHPDLVDNIWVNEGETYGSKEDADGNGYKGDRHGYNFATDRGYISVAGTNDSGHGTHVAGTIAAVNNNGIGVSGIAGGDKANGQSGVKIMSCQIFDDSHLSTLAMEAKAIKYAADNGAVVLQCSWGYNSALADPIVGYTPGPASEKQWATTYPLEKEAFEYFLHNAGSPNGVIDGGVVVFAAGNEYAGMPAYPGAYSKFICVGALSADYTPSTYTDYGVEVDLSAPGGDGDYYGEPGAYEPNGNGGMILSTLIIEGKPSYGFYEGTSMACPHVSGVAALGLSYAAQLRKHFKAEEFTELLKHSSTELDSYFDQIKLSHFNHTSPGTSANKKDLSVYKGRMGRMAKADLLLNAIENSGTAMVVPNIYVAPEKVITIDLARYFVEGEHLAYTCTVADTNIASVSVEGTKMQVQGMKEGNSTISIQTSNGKSQTVTVTVRKNADSNGWM